MAVLQGIAQHRELLIEILDECLRLMQLFGGDSGELNRLDLLRRGLFVTTTGHLSISQLAIRKGLHSESYPFPPGASLSRIASLALRSPCALRRKGRRQDRSGWEPILSNDGSSDHNCHAKNECRGNDTHRDITVRNQLLLHRERGDDFVDVIADQQQDQ